MTDEFELPPGYTWEHCRAEADRINAFKAAHPDFPGGPVTPEHLARCYREEQEFEAREAAKWAALTPAEQDAMTALEAVADEEIDQSCEIIIAALRRRPGVATGRKLREVLLPTDPDFAEVTAAMQRLTAVADMLGID